MKRLVCLKTIVQQIPKGRLPLNIAHWETAWPGCWLLPKSVNLLLWKKITSKHHHNTDSPRLWYVSVHLEHSWSTAVHHITQTRMIYHRLGAITVASCEREASFYTAVDDLETNMRILSFRYLCGLENICDHAHFGRDDDKEDNFCYIMMYFCNSTTF